MGARSPRESLAFAVATGLVSIVPVGRLPRGVRMVIAGVSGAATGAAAYAVLRKTKDLPVRQAALVGAGAGTVLAGATAAGFSMDRAFEQALVRRDVPHPRLVLGAGAVVLSYAMDVLDRRFDTSD